MCGSVFVCSSVNCKGSTTAFYIIPQKSRKKKEGGGGGNENVTLCAEPEMLFYTCRLCVTG